MDIGDNPFFFLFKHVSKMKFVALLAVSLKLLGFLVLEEFLEDSVKSSSERLERWLSCIRAQAALPEVPGSISRPQMAALCL